VLLRRDAEAAQAARASHDPHSPWHRTDGWRLNADDHHVLSFVDGDREVRVVAHYRRGGILLDLPGGPLLARGERGDGGDLVADLGGARLRATVIRQGDGLVVLVRGQAHRLGLHDPDAARVERADEGRLTAAMPGKIVAVMVEPGARVKKGAPLVVLEAMKMEHTITSPRDGTVARLHFGVGAVVEEGAQLLALEAAEAAA
jgi:3-methylcrotonyl-CoA carboxylase alpha subunit